MRESRPSLSRSVEDYLKAIFAITERGEAASTSAIAAALEVQPASVTGMVKRLAETGLLQHVPYRGVRLTGKGIREALRVIRRHRILETYLLQRLGYSWDDVHEEAERLEHAASERLIDAMAAALEDPSHDPHGSPIPTSAGEIEAVDFATLADAGTGEHVRIRAVDDAEPEGLRSMEARGLVPGARLHVEREGEGGALTVRVDGAKGAGQVVEPELARRIYVTPDR
jgi:DtxR family transcriptional regulator, Mn-dependent transcriptional regulator